jgi:uncharacterized protein involved in type VI secretion and phage assembly
MNKMNKYYGIYRGTVVNNVDPMQLGRIHASIPSAGVPSAWAMPSVPIAGTQMGVFVVPQVGSGVWIQFEAGDVEFPVWIGGWWRNASEVPALAFPSVPGDPNIVLQSALQNAIVISDLPGPPGGIMLKSAGGATITVNDSGIYISNGKGATIAMVGPTVSINNGAQVIT